MRAFLSLLFLSITAAAATPLAPVALTNAPYVQRPLDVASNGTGFLTAWFDTRSTLDIEQGNGSQALVVARLNADGTTALPAGRRLAPFVINAKLARNGAGYLLAWNDFGNLWTMLLDAGGAPTGDASRVAKNAAPLALANNGSNFLFLYADNAGTHAAILAANGTVTHDTTILGDIESSPVWVLPNGNYQFVAFKVQCMNVICSSAVWLTTVSSAGAVTEEKLFDLPRSTQIAAAYGNGHVLVANKSDTQGGSVWEYRLFDSSAAPLHSAVQVAADPSYCYCQGGALSVGWDGSEFLMAWNSASDLRAVRVTSDGVLLDGAAPIILDPAPGTVPVFASNGAMTAIVWGSDAVVTDVVSRSVRSFDDLAATKTNLVSQSAALERGVQLASGPNGPLAVWRARYPNPAIAGGIVGGAATTIAPANAFDLQSPAAARGRDAFLVVWREQQINFYDQDKSFRIMGRRVSFLGVPLEAPFVIASSTLPFFTSASPTIAVASDGTNWLVAFPDDQLTLSGVRVSPDGAVLDSKPVTLSLGPPHFGIPGSPHIVWSAGRYVVVWAEDPRDPVVGPPGPPLSELYEARLSAAGQVIDKKQIWNGGFVPDLALAAAPDRLFLAWVENYVSVDGMILGGDGTPLTNARAIFAPQSARIDDVDAAWDGSSFATAWTMPGSFATANAVYEHVDANGVPIEPAPLDFAPELTTKYTPSLAPSPGGVTVAFEAIGDTDVSRAFATTIDRVGQPPRRRAAR